jgi:ACS family glucarate transporter-like MFS transporter
MKKASFPVRILLVFNIDISKENAGAVSGAMNMAENPGAFVTIIAFPYIYKWIGSFQPFSYVGMVLSAIAIALWFSKNPGKTIRT